jgi:hypothetical protein
MNRKLLIATILITALGSLGAVESAVAMIAKPESMVPSFEHYPPNDPCFDQKVGYLCTPSAPDQQTQPSLESDKSKKDAKNRNFEEVNNYPW